MCYFSDLDWVMNAIDFIKVDNFRNSNNKNQYSYLLTPKGIEEKAKLTLDFIRIKTQEYDTLKQESESLKPSCSYPSAKPGKAKAACAPKVTLKPA